MNCFHFAPIVSTARNCHTWQKLTPLCMCDFWNLFQEACWYHKSHETRKQIPWCGIVCGSVEVRGWECSGTSCDSCDSNTQSSHCCREYRRVCWYIYSWCETKIHPYIITASTWVFYTVLYYILQRFFTEEGSSRFLWNFSNFTSLSGITPQETAAVILSATVNVVSCNFNLKEEGVQHIGRCSCVLNPQSTQICLEKLCKHHGCKHALNLVFAVFIYGRKSVLCWEWGVMEAFRTLNCMDL